MGSPTRNASSTVLATRHHMAAAGLSGEVLPKDRYTCAEVRKDFLRGGQLVPPPRRTLPDFPAEMLADLAVADAMLAHSRAQSTREAYGRHVEAWLAWAEAGGACPLPADPAAVASFLVHHLTERDEHDRPKLDVSGRPVARVAVVSTQQRLAALNRLHELAGLTAPGTDPRVRELMKALRRAYGTRPKRAKAALTFDLVERMVGTVLPATLTELRRQVLVSLHEATKATPGQLARLTWSSVRLEASGALLWLPPTHVGTPTIEVHVPAGRKPDRSCVQLLTALRDQTSTWPGDLVFREPSGEGLSRQGIYKLLRQRRATPAAPQPGKRSAREIRDRALLLAGWTMAQRRSNLSALNWDEVTPLPGGGWRIYLAKSKTDQEGRGRTVLVPPQAPGSTLPDAAEALADWLAVVRQALGYDPRTVIGIPVFCRIDQTGRLRRDGDSLARLSGAGVNGIVQAYAAAAGLPRTLSASGHPIAPGVNPYGAHSLRSGYVTEANRHRQPLAATMRQTGHQSVSTLMRYDHPLEGADLAAQKELFSAIQSERDDDLSAVSGPPPARRPRYGPTAVNWAPLAEPMSEVPGAVAT